MSTRPCSHISRHQQHLERVPVLQERYTRDPEPFDWYQRWAGLKARWTLLGDGLCMLSSCSGQDTFAEYVQPAGPLSALPQTTVFSCMQRPTAS